MSGVRQQLYRNVFSSWFAYLVRIIIVFFFVPYIASILGDTRYGAWIIIFQTVSFFSLLDLGLTSGMTRYISKYLSSHDFDRINRILNTANLLYIIVGAAVFLGVWAFVEFFFGYIKIADPAVAAEARSALLILGAFMAFNFIALPFGNTLGAFHRYDITNGLNMAEEIVRAALMIFLLYQGHGLVALALVILLLTVVKHLVGAGLLLKLQPRVDLGRHFVKRETAVTLFGYSKISLGISVCWIILFNADPLFLGVIGSSALAGIYHPGAQLMRYLRNLINAVAIPLIPAISHKEAQGDLEPVRELYVKSVRYIGYLSFAVATGVIIYAADFVSLWLPEEFAGSADVMRVLAVGTAFLLPQLVGHAILFGIERHRRLLFVLVIEAALKVILAIFLIPRFGLLGMAAAVSLPQIAIFTTIYPLLVSRALKLPLTRILATESVAALSGTVITAAFALGAHWAIVPFTWTRLAIGIAIVVTAVMLGAWRILLPDDRRRVTLWIS